jgi:hypothetical protein
MPGFAPKTSVKSAMPLRWNACVKPPRMTVSPSLPRSLRRKPLSTYGVHAAPMFGAKLFQSVLYALVPLTNSR